jgi:lambda family phage portal protein
MIKLSDELYIPPMGQVLAERELAERKRASAQRAYAAAKPNRLNAGWTTTPTGANYELRGGVDALRARARQTARDNGHVQNFLRLMRTNVVGPKGIQLQSRARLADGKTLNVRLNKRVEEAWFEWGHREYCTVSGKNDWRGVQKLVLTQLLRDGEFLVEMIEDVGEFGFSLKVWDINWLDATFTQELPGGNRIIMSVEVDPNDKPIAYWLTPPTTEMDFARNRQRLRARISADRMIHGYLIEDDDSQVRSVSWLTPALLDIKNFGGYVDGVVTSARVAANTFGVLEQTMPDGMEPPQFTGDETPAGVQQHPYIESSPLSITPLLPGWKLNQLDPKQPTQNHPEFAKTMQTSIGTDLGVPYFLLVGDWEAVNFSSSRGGLGEFREMCKDLQDFIAMVLCRPVFHKFVYQAMLKGKLVVDSRGYFEIQNPTWRGRGWRYIDPTKDVAADVERLRNRLATPSEILAEQGTDYVDHLERWEADRKLAAQYGIDIEAIYSELNTPEASTEPKNDGEEKPKQAQDDGERSYTNGKYAN